MFVAVFFVIFLSSAFLTGFMRVYALNKNVIDVPNSRSSHSAPTPRGGGLSIVATSLVTIAILGGVYDGYEYQILGLLCAGFIVALIGFIDDHGHIDAKWRLLVHLLAASIIVYAAGGLPVLNLLGWEVDFCYMGYILAVITIVWLLNLFNFMDGIDGIAGVEAVTTTFFAGLFIYILEPTSLLIDIHWFITAASLGFLVLNFPPAKIFMGDAGSGYLGFVMGALALISSHLNSVMLWAWLILLGVFIVDSTYTVIIRLFGGEKIHEAHRSHAYQYASRIYGSHLRVTLCVLIINIIWLAPMAYLVISGAVNGVLGIIIAYFPLILLVRKYKAGKREVVPLNE